MAALIRGSGFRIKISYLSLVVLIIFCMGRATAGVYSENELKSLINEYKTRISVLNSQIQDVQKDKDWLVLKINRISDSGRKVSSLLYTSVLDKEQKIAQLEKQKKRLEAGAAAYEKEYQSNFLISKTSASPIKPIVTDLDDSFPMDKVSRIRTAIQKAGLADWVEIQGADGCAKISNTLPILFSSGSAVLPKQYKPFLRKLSQFLKTYDVKVYVAGYADSDPIRTKQYPSNFELGAYRAANVIHEMVRHGLKPDIFKIGTTGEYNFTAKQPSSKKTFQRRAQVTVVFSS